jgi:pSer/pThr/pTyr-binding forkhead associated (FHA) protein
MDEQIGIVCGRCDWYSAMKTTACPSCGNDLALFPKEDATQNVFRQGSGSTGKKTATAAEASSSAPTISARELGHEEAEPTSSMFEDRLKPRRISSGKLKLDLPSSGRIRATNKAGQDLGRTNEQVSAGNQAASMSTSGLSLEELMDQAKNFVCKSCSTAVPMGHKFCGRCGAAVPPEILNARTQFFGQLQVPGKAKLILIRGEGVEGLSYQLNAEQHVVGRNGQLVFPDDPFVSPKHANLFYRGGKLVVRDEGSLNGVYLRVRGTVDVASGDCFLAGEQLFRLDATPKLNDGPAPDGTYFYSSPKHQSSFRLVQLLQGGAEGMIVCARSNGLQIGREGGDLNFPTDLYMSASHCKIEDNGGKLSLTDLNSRNGTYVKISAERELAHGDYLFIGRKLLRVEITAA